MNYNIATTPLYFVRSGSMNISVAYLRNVGFNGFIWGKSTTDSPETYTPAIYHLVYNATQTNPSNGPAYRWVGLPLRCKPIFPR